MTAILRIVVFTALAALAACATARPVFEQAFSGGEQGHGQWVQLLRSRYGCDVVDTLSAHQLGARTSFGQHRSVEESFDAPVCRITGGGWPLMVRAWTTSAGMREEWSFVAPMLPYTRTTGRPWTLVLEGPDPTRLLTRRVY